MKLQQWFHSNEYVHRQQVKMDEAKKWYEEIYGTGKVHRDGVLNDMAARYDDYLALVEEVDAWRVGGKAKAKVRQLIQNHRVEQAAAAAARAPAVVRP